MANEEKAGDVTRRAGVARMVAGETVTVVPSAITSAAAGDKPPSKTPSDPAPSKSSWNFPQLSTPAPSSSPIFQPLPSSSAFPQLSAPPRSAGRGGRETTEPVTPTDPGPAAPGSFDLL